MTVVAADWVDLCVNGATRRVPGRGRLLLDVLRDDFGLAGPKEGCGVGVCGTCTVLLNGSPVSACLLLAALAEGQEVLTVEGLGRDGHLHPVQQAFIDAGALECGYCTPGMVLAAVALLRDHPTPTPEDVRVFLGGHLCRCTGYHSILRAVHMAQERLAASALGPAGE